MHLTINELRALAACYRKEELLNTEQFLWKQHMSQCDSCYEKFCTEFMLQKILTKHQIISEEIIEASLRMSIPEQVCLKIQLRKRKLQVLASAVQKQSDMWNFFPMPQFAFERGSGKDNTDKLEQQIFVSKSSEYSFIKKEKDKLIIQLDKDEYPIEQLRVVYELNKEVIYKEFIYDTDSDCWIVEFEQSEIDNVNEIAIVDISR